MPGDLLEVSEAHTPELRASVRVSAAGTVTLPLAGEVQVAGMDELAAAHAIEAALIERGMLLHPQVTVLVTVYAGQDVSVLGEVTRPGVYSYHGASSAAGPDFCGFGLEPECGPAWSHYRIATTRKTRASGGAGSLRRQTRRRSITPNC